MSLSGEPTQGGAEAPETPAPQRQRRGRYLELRLLGCGGMGAVYRAYDPQLERLVAIKILRESSPSFLARFRREARAMARLSHPHVARIHDFGEDPDSGEPFLVMEYVGGPALDQLMAERGPLPPAEVERLLRQAAEGLRAAHEAGIVHRDIKPSNLLLVGWPPFEGPSAAAVALRQMGEDLPDLARLAPHTPRGLRQGVGRLAEKDPAARPQTADELLRELDRAAAPPARPGRLLPAALLLGLGAVLLRAWRGSGPLPRRPPAAGGAAATAGSAGPPRVAVLPFKNLGGERDLDFLAEGLAEMALARLGRTGVPLVERLQVERPLRESDFGQTRYVDPATWAALGRILSVGIAMQGGFQRAGGALRVTARLVRVETGEILDMLVLTRPAADPLGLQDLVAEELAWRLAALRQGG